MSAERIVHIVAGSFILLSMAPGAGVGSAFGSNLFLLCAAFAEMNLRRSEFAQPRPLTIARCGSKISC